MAESNVVPIRKGVWPASNKPLQWGQRAPTARKVAACSAIGGALLFIEFSDGTTHVADLSGVIELGAFKQLREPSEFRAVRAIDGTVMWENGLRLDPTVLWMNAMASRGRWSY